MSIIQGLRKWIVDEFSEGEVCLVIPGGATREEAAEAARWLAERANVEAEVDELATSCAAWGLDHHTVAAIQKRMHCFDCLGG